MWPVLQTFRPRDAIDIVLVAIVLYRVLVMFKETRAVQMLLGLAGLMVASFLARYFELFSTSWLLDNFWSFWVLALIVLFQPELRRALTRLGQSRLFQGTSLGAREERTHLLDQVIRRRTRSRASASAPSSCWSGPPACATTRSSASRSTRSSPPTCS
jgi:diadenylate cyclase